MDLVLTTFGTYLHRQGDMFVIKIKDDKTEMSARKVRSILITTGASFSTDAIQLAVENNIDIVFLDKYGDPYGRVWHGRPGSTIAIRREQLRIADTAQGMVLVREWVGCKLGHQIELLKAMRARRTRLHSELTDKLEQLSALQQRVGNVTGALDEMRGMLMGLEGRAGRTYWEAVNLLLPASFQFAERSRNPAKDEFNCLLNYAYGVLYGTVERACVIAGLDPYVGFLHTDHYQKKSLVFDLIENYRVWADETVLSLFTAKQVNDDLFDRLENGLRLNKAGKKVLLDVLGKHLEESILYRRRRIKRRDTVQLDCHHLANTWIGRIEDEDDGDVGVDYV